MIAKSTVIKGWGGKSGGRAGKAVELTSGDLRRVRKTGKRAARFVIATEKSADGMVGGTSFAEGPNTGKTIWMWKPRAGHAAEIQVEARTAPLKGAEADATESTI